MAFPFKTKVDGDVQERAPNRPHLQVAEVVAENTSLQVNEEDNKKLPHHLLPTVRIFFLLTFLKIFKQRLSIIEIFPYKSFFGFDVKILNIAYCSPNGVACLFKYNRMA